MGSASEQGPRSVGGHGPAPGRLVSAVAYGVLFLVGLFEGLTGAFQFGRGPAKVPVIAICFALGIGGTCWLAGWGMRSAGGAFAPALGWLVAAFGMALPGRNGTVVITGTSAGEVFLYGGAVCAAVGAAMCFSALGRSRAAPPAAEGASASRGPRG